MATKIIMPKMGLSMVTGKVARWLKREGETVRHGDAVLEVMTDKITNILEAPADGILLKIVAGENEDLPIGALLGFIGTAGETVPEIAGKVPVTTGSAGSLGRLEEAGAGEAGTLAAGKARISPVARKLAETNGLNIARITGSGPGGRITREDVEKAIAAATGITAAEPVRPADDQPISAGQPAFSLRPYSGLRRVIGDNMASSWAVAPKVTYHVSVDASALLALRQAINEAAAAKITVTDMLVKIAAKALKMRPNINASLAGDVIRIYQEVNIGVAVALDNGLVVPVVRNADGKTLSQVSREIKDFSQRARENRLDVEEMRGGTFTITNIGSYQSVDWFTPIINQPESAILGVGRTVDTPVAKGGEVCIRPMLGLSLAFDHRVVDGAPAAEFLGLLIRLMEKPYSVFI